MTTINFTNSLGLTTAFTNHDLDLILTELNTHDSSFAAGENQICYIMLNPGYLLLMDLNTISIDDYSKCMHLLDLIFIHFS